jgi:hypothetical protein
MSSYQPHTAVELIAWLHGKHSGLEELIDFIKIRMNSIYDEAIEIQSVSE